MYQWSFLNIDELLYIFHSWIGKPIVYILSFQWLFDLGKLNFAGDGEGGFFGSLARIFYSRPSLSRDSVAEMQNPSDQQGFWEFIGSVFLGRGDHESVFSLIFGTFLGWFVFGALVFAGILWLIKTKSHLLDEKEKLMYDTVISRQEKDAAGDKSGKWQEITEMVGSDDSSKWKVAIMEADILLAEVLDENGYSGATVADRLKSAQSGNFETLQYAWEAHKVRNKIAHDAAFVLEKREAQNAILFYEKFFSDLYHMN